MDNLTKKQRSYVMSRIRSENTGPEMRLRKALWKQGIRGYRLHAKLPGKPDLVFASKKVAVFIDGCFWHKCQKCFKKPASNKKYWNWKIQYNVAKDKRISKELKERGWKVLRFWEHELKQNPYKCINRIKRSFS